MDVGTNVTTPSDDGGGLGGLVEAWYREYYGALVRIAFFQTGSLEAAEDVVGDVFAGLAGRRPDVENPGAYLRRAVVNRVHSLHRRLRVARTSPLPLPATVGIEACETFDVLQKLPIEQRTVVVLHYWDGMTIDEIAEVMERPRGTVASWQHRALTRLREVLEP